MGEKSEYESRWEPDYAIADQPDWGDQETKVHGNIKCSVIGTQLVSLGTTRK